MSRTRRVLFASLALAALVVLAVVFLRSASPSGRGTGTGGEPGQNAPLFDSTDLSGHPVALSSYRGHRVVLNFWASWCVPCRAEFPVLRQLQSQHPDVIVLGVVFQDSDAPAASFMRAEGATWAGVRDPRAQIATAYGVFAKPGIPVSILVDASGRVRGRQYGPLTTLGSADAFIAQAPAG